MRRRSLPLIFVIVTCFYWKLTLTRQYAFLETFDLANQVLPWLELQVSALQHGQVALWTPYEWMGQPLLGQMQPGVFSPFTWLLALAPLRDGFLQFHWVNWWFVLIHLAGAWFMWAMLRDVGLREAAAVIGGVLYACIGFYGSTDWPHVLASAIWAPLVFLYVFRVLRGERPMASACLSGVFLAMAWLSGYFASAYYLSLAALVVLTVGLWQQEGPRSRRIRILGAWLAVAGAVSAPQILPAAEYGRAAIRWTATGPLRWDQKVGLPEHFDSGMKGSDIPHLVIPGADLHAEPFTGAIALGLAGLALVGGRGRRERIALTSLAVASMLFVLAQSLFLYGALYALVPMLEKSRAPVNALCVFHFAVAALAAFGLDNLLSGGFSAAARRMARGLALFGGLLLILITVLGFLPSFAGSVFNFRDPRIFPLCLVALLFAGGCFAFLKGVIGARTAAVLLGFFVLAEQGQVAGYAWPHATETSRRTLLPPLENTRDLADFLRPLQPARVEIKRDDGLMFIFGDWFRIHTVEALSASMLANTMDLNWWSDRCSRLFGVRYTIAKNSTRPNQREVFRGKAGLGIFENPAALPRAWTVHKLRIASNQKQAADWTRDGDFDLAQEGVVTGTGPVPQVETCVTPDQVHSTKFELNSVSVDVTMGCRGLVMVADNWYPGWRGNVDGRRAAIERVDFTLRGIAVGAGRHTVTMNYLPWSMMGGFGLMLLGLAFTAWNWRRAG